MTLLTEDWGYPVDMAELDPADPLVNTDSEYMFQMATIGYHVLHGTQTVVLEEAVEYNGETFEAGPHEVAIDGRYWTDFDRMHPLEGPAREMAWSGTAHGLFGELGVGTVTHSALQLAWASPPCWPDWAPPSSWQVPAWSGRPAAERTPTPRSGGSSARPSWSDRPAAP